MQTQPKTRQRIQKEPPPLDLPDINDDAAERKRVLNVLAQRRYRARKRQTRAVGGTLVTPDPETAPRPQQGGGPLQAGATAPVSDLSGIELELHSQLTLPLDRSHPNTIIAGDVAAPNNPVGGVDLEGPWMTSALDLTTRQPSSLTEAFLHAAAAVSYSSASTASNGDGASSASSSGGLAETIDPSILFGSSPPASDGSDVFSFPDSYLLPVSELTLLRAFLRIAQRLGCEKSVWDPGAQSPFYSSSSQPPSPSPSTSSSALLHLPKTWQPTPLQVVLPHHPMLDFLPWPGARDRAIQVFSLPEELRPSAEDGTPLGLYQLVYDVEDAAEGMRIYGGDPYDAGSWEVGQLLFERWWFIFDREIVEQSNQWRSLRGAPRLRLKDGVEAAPS